MEKIDVEFLGRSPDLKPAIAAILRRSDADFSPPLSARLDLDAYAEKLANASDAFFIGAWNQPKSELICLYVGYAREGFEYSFSPYMWVAPEYRSFFLGLRLHSAAVRHLKSLGMRGIRAKTWVENNDALLAFYKNLGYKISEPKFDVRLNRREVDLELTFK
ncbi:MAG: GNAT family N-acetyltransferase [Candidatus Merdousia sp.]|nr:GNAT family N-acetyltransferase [Candidatus Merdousia sp.]